MAVIQTKRLLSLVLAITLIFLISSSAFAAETESDTSTTESFYVTNEDGTVSRVEIIGYSDSVTTRVYVGDVLTQESTGSLSSDTITTKIYDSNGQVTSTSDLSISSITSTNSIPVTDSISSVAPELGTNVFVPVDPGMGGGGGDGDDEETLPQRDIMDEPVDNRGLVYTHTDDDMDYYYLGESIAFDVTGQLYRTYVSRYIGETEYLSWPAGTALCAISTSLEMVFADNLVEAILSALKFVADQLYSDQGIKLATYEHDYYYQVHVDGDCIYEIYRYRTYWHIDNVATGVTKYHLKSNDGGTVYSNIDIVRNAILHYN